MKSKKMIVLFIAVLVIIVSIVSIHGIFAGSEEAAPKTATAQNAVSEPTSFRASSRTENSVKFRWSASEGASGYQLQRRVSGVYETVGKTSEKSFTVSGLGSGKTYRYRIRAYGKVNGKTVFSKFVYLYACTSPSKVTVKSTKCDNRKVTVIWKKQSCSGYQLQYSTKRDFSDYKSKSILGSDTVSVTTKTLFPDAKYYFRIRAFVICNNKRYYSDWKKLSLTTDAGYKTTSKGYKIEEKNGVTYVDGVLIANKTYSIPKSYAPDGLTKECSEAFSKMRSAAAKDGINLYIVSGYRSYDTQKNLYNRYAANSGKAQADTYSARPGHSEHQTGLAMDLNSLYTSFGDTKEGKWLAKNCYKYGFIIRYPKGKEAVTGYIYEPWHVRYLGVQKATKIYDSGLCLEEYYGITSKYS